MTPLRLLKLGAPAAELPTVEACAEHLRALAMGDKIALSPAELSVGGNGSVPALAATVLDPVRPRFLGYVVPADAAAFAALPERYDPRTMPRAEPMRAALASILGCDLRAAA
jgi:hypothetical protein